MRFLSPVKTMLRDWLFSLLGFGFVALALSEQFVAQTSATWSQAARSSARDWLPWIVLTPLLFRLVRWLPLARQRWVLAVPVHILCCITTLAACDAWARTVDPDFEAGGPGTLGKPKPRFNDHGAQVPEVRENNPLASGTGISGASSLPPRGSLSGPPLVRFDMIRIVGFYLPIYCAVVGVAHALHFYRRSQEGVASLTLTRLETLKMQLQPHFLFNTLNMIAELIYKEPRRADAMLTALSDLLRFTLETSGTRVVPLSREMDFVERYLAIMHARFEERLRFALDIAPDTDTALVPTLVLQPLVENAVEHGLKNVAGDGLITIRSWRDGAALHLSVADNGTGLPKNKPAREGIGLSNTRARLRELYGDAARLDIREADGVVVELTLPFRPRKI
jgi:two-component sensor histidine kinase